MAKQREINVIGVSKNRKEVKIHVGKVILPFTN